ncbi:hypothetical protein Clacol_000193 [Clathrus columnatus]|uniref:Uncharacterized protein n=1 Tax=Clathrus columnatus TaxID=1419009 RepID=A0AAV5A0A3_9AGAM|nr:hypothetical protein Clacol_000193 [Clathrus columnatus]
MGNIAGVVYTGIENVLTSMIICEFTLDLRKRNEQKPVPDQSLSLAFVVQDNPTQSGSGSVSERLHKRIFEE